ncbi:MAG TPA: hypothetical protein VGG98_09435 [Solirubrobacteraceae bacterium]
MEQSEFGRPTLLERVRSASRVLAANAQASTTPLLIVDSGRNYGDNYPDTNLEFFLEHDGYSLSSARPLAIRFASRRTPNGVAFLHAVVAGHA